MRFIQGKRCNPFKIHNLVFIGVVLLCSIILAPERSYSEEFEFDMSEFDKKPYSLGGHIEFSPAFQGIDKDSVFYRLRFPDGNESDIEGEYSVGALIDISLQKGIAGIFLETSVNHTDSYRGTDHDADIFQGYLSLK